MRFAAVFLGATLCFWVNVSMAHGIGEEVRVMLSFAILIYGLMVQSLLVLVMLIARSFSRKKVVVAILSVSVLIVGLGLPAIISMWDGSMTVSGSRVNIYSLIAIGSGFCFGAPLLQYLVLFRSREVRG